MGMILFMTGYQQQPIATGSITKRCNLLMKLDKTFSKGKLHSTKLGG